jgi:hypothetical protein
MPFVYDHGLVHGEPGRPPLLRLCLGADGLLAASRVEPGAPERPAGALALSAARAAELRSFVAPERLPSLGHRVGYGPSWGVLRVPGPPACEIELRWSSPPGSLDADRYRDVAPSVEPALKAFARLLARLLAAGRRPAALDWAEVCRGLRATGPTPVTTEGPGGRLALRYCQFSMNCAERDRGRWLKLYEGGAVELRADADADDDGRPTGRSVDVGAGGARELVARIDALGLTRGYPLSEHNVCYERYVGGDVARARFGWDSEMGALITECPLTRDQIHDLVDAFGALFRRLEA